VIDVDDDMLSRLAALDTCIVSDALDRLRLEGHLDALRPMWEGARLVGRAITVQLAEGPAPADAPKVHLGARAIGVAQAGNVIVVANDGRVGMGSWGGMLTLAAMQKGVAGVVLDGSCRDLDEQREHRFPVFARGGAARTARGRVHEASFGEPVKISGCTVHPGDLIIADSTAVIAIRAADAERVLTVAAELAAAEKRMSDQILAGAPAEKVLDGSYEDATTAVASD
jgi:4-hydroxy-4-methyl-2-oxoglutarate aldolase